MWKEVDFKSLNIWICTKVCVCRIFEITPLCIVYHAYIDARRTLIPTVNPHLQMQTHSATQFIILPSLVTQTHYNHVLWWQPRALCCVFVYVLYISQICSHINLNNFMWFILQMQLQLFTSFKVCIVWKLKTLCIHFFTTVYRSKSKRNGLVEVFVFDCFQIFGLDHRKVVIYVQRNMNRIGESFTGKYIVLPKY